MRRELRGNDESFQFSVFSFQFLASSFELPIQATQLKTEN
jgi:hypothetical protein